jgi:hypothetical protein
MIVSAEVHSGIQYSLTSYFSGGNLPALSVQRAFRRCFVLVCSYKQLLIHSLVELLSCSSISLFSYYQLGMAPSISRGASVNARLLSRMIEVQSQSRGASESIRFRLCIISEHLGSVPSSECLWQRPGSIEYLRAGGRQGDDGDRSCNQYYISTTYMSLRGCIGIVATMPSTIGQANVLVEDSTVCISITYRV